MCGIIGALAFEGKLKIGEKQRREAIIMLVTELLQLTRSRGKDATGISTLFNDGRYIGLKMGVESTEFISRFGETETDYDGFLKLWREDEEKMRMFLGHCRKSSVGNSWDNVNNHPIKVGDIVGIHNGTLTNHDEIFKYLKCKRDGDVDSEAIFRLLNHYTREGQDPFTPEIIQETTKRMHGSYAVMTYNGNNPYQTAIFRDGRPVEMVLVKPLNLVLVASEKVFLQQALFKLTKAIHLYKTLPKSMHVSDQNLDFKMMIDDSLAIFDLTQEITEHTKVTDLYYEEKIPRNAKIWGKATTTTTTTYKAGSTTHNSSHKTAWQKQQDKEEEDKKKKEEEAKKKDKTEVFAKSIKTSNKDDKKPGFVYNKSLKSYMNEEADPKDEDKGNIEINTAIAGKVSDLDSEDNDITIPSDNESSFELENKDKIEALICSEASITESKITGEKAKVIQMAKTKPEPIVPKQADIIELETEKDAEALELAEKFTKDLVKFKTDDELIAGIELDDDKVLKALKPISLANRVTSFASRFAYYHGFVEGKEKAEAPNAIKTRKAQKDFRLANVRRFKIMTLKMAEMIDSHPIDEDKKGQIIDKGIKQLLGAPSTEITPETLKKMYSAGDLRTSFTLKRVMAVIKEGKIEDAGEEEANTGAIKEDGQK